MEKRIEALEKRVAALEEQAQKRQVQEMEIKLDGRIIAKDVFEAIRGKPQA